VTVVLSLSWRQRAPETKLPADPESRRALTGMETSAAVRITMVVRDFILFIGGRMALTMGQRGRVGHAEMTCPGAPQYKHNPWVSHLCRSVKVSWVFSSCMGSLASSGGLMDSGRQRDDVSSDWPWWSSWVTVLFCDQIVSAH